MDTQVPTRRDVMSWLRPMVRLSGYNSELQVLERSEETVKVRLFTERNAYTLEFAWNDPEGHRLCGLGAQD